VFIGVYLGSFHVFEFPLRIDTVDAIQQSKAVNQNRPSCSRFIKSLVAMAGLVASVAAGPIVHGAEAPGDLTALLQTFVDQKIAPGVVVLVANKDGVLALEKSGYASLADKTSMRDDGVFWIASMSKSLTATALIMLVDEGTVSLDDPVETYLPEFKGQMVEQGDQPPHPPRHPITVREIMSHTSGLVLACFVGCCCAAVNSTANAISLKRLCAR